MARYSDEGGEAMMPILKFSALTCAVYLLIVLLLELATIVFARLFGGVIFGGRPWGIALFFASIWVLSYSVAQYAFRFPPSSR
jgi:hypothetical protein